MPTPLMSTKSLSSLSFYEFSVHFACQCVSVQLFNIFHVFEQLIRLTAIGLATPTQAVSLTQSHSHIYQYLCSLCVHLPNKIENIDKITFIMFK